MTTDLPVNKVDLPDLTEMLVQNEKRIAGNGYFGTVYRCPCKQYGEVAVKAITFPSSISESARQDMVRKMKRELGIWKRLPPNPNIVPLLGTAYGGDFGSDHPCMVSMWMPHGTLAEYVNRDKTVLSLPTRIRLIKGMVAGLEYLHSKCIIHGDFHPGNIMIDKDHNARLTDFGLSQTSVKQNHLTYLWTASVRPCAAMWVAPELLVRDSQQSLKSKAPTRPGDVYSLGSIILFTLSGKFPWNKDEVESKLREGKNPPRPLWPVIPDDVWAFIEQCWSPELPSKRPSAQEALLFTRDKLEQVLQPNPESDINVVLFGRLGCGKSSIINLFTNEPVAQVSADAEPCTKQPQWYQISIEKRRFRLWDTMGFRLADGGDTSPLSPYEQAFTVLRNLPCGVNLILLCAHKDRISSLSGLYWLINDFFYGGRAPIAFVVTHSDAPDEQWWDRNQYTIAQKFQNIGIPIQHIPYTFSTTVVTCRDRSKQALKELLETYAATVVPVPLRLNISPDVAASLSVGIADHCGLSDSDAATLMKGFSPINVVFFGKAGSGKSSVINLIATNCPAQVTSDIESSTLNSSAYMIDTPTKQFRIWDTMGFNGVRNGQDMTRQAVLNAVQLIQDLSGEGGVDLLVFVKKCGKLTPSELNCYRLFEEFLCGGKVPVALVITHLEEYDPMEKWWTKNGDNILKTLSGNVIGNACITSLGPEDSKFSDKVSKSRLTVQAMLEGCAPYPKGEGDGQADGPEMITIENLMNRCGLTRELAKEFIKLYNDSG